MLSMRTEWLQQQFPDVYQQFYSAHDLVVSVPHLFRRSSSITSGTNSPSIKQVLPLRLYIGVTQTPHTGVRIERCHVYDHIATQRKTQSMRHIIEESDHFASTIDCLLQKLGYTWGITINVMTEVPRGQWFGLRSAFTAASALAITALTHTTEELPLDTPARYGAKANKTTRYIASLLDMMATQRDTYSHHIALCGYQEPLIYRWGTLPAQKLRDIFAHHDLFEALEKYEDLLDEHFENSYTPLSKITPINGNKLPFDYAIVFLWQHHASVRIHHTHQQLDHHNATLRAMANTLSGLVTQKDLDHLVQFDTKNIGNYHTFQQIAQLYQALAMPYDKWHIAKRIQSVVDAGRMHSLIEKEHHLLTEIYHLYEQNNTWNSALWLVPLTSAKKWWCVLMVMPYEEGRNAFEATITQLQQQYPQLCVHHQSRRDAGPVPGPQIHQFISQEQYTTTSKPGSVLLREAGGYKKIVPYTELKTTLFSGIVLDTISGKVLVNGQKVTHKDLVTQSGTIEVMVKLLERPGEFIHHADLPISSYTRNKNEMLGKVVTPLKELIKKHYNIDIPLTCDGSTYDFHICLENDAWLFHVIEKPFAHVSKTRGKR